MNTLYCIAIQNRIDHGSPLGPFIQVFFDDRGAKMGLDAVVTQSNGWQDLFYSDLPWNLTGKPQISLLAYPFLGYKFTCTSYGLRCCQKRILVSRQENLFYRDLTMHLQLAKLCCAVYTTEYILFLFFTERISKSRQGNLFGLF